jgi:hypothetical protein
VRVRGAKNIIRCLTGAATPEPCGESWHYTTVLGGISAAVRHGGTASTATPDPCGRSWHYTAAIRHGEAAGVAVLEKISDYKNIQSGHNEIIVSDPYKINYPDPDLDQDFYRRRIYGF